MSENNSENWNYQPCWILRMTQKKHNPSNNLQIYHPSSPKKWVILIHRTHPPMPCHCPCPPQRCLCHCWLPGPRARTSARKWVDLWQKTRGGVQQIQMPRENWLMVNDIVNVFYMYVMMIASFCRSWTKQILQWFEQQRGYLLWKLADNGLLWFMIVHNDNTLSCGLIATAWTPSR